MAPKCRKVPGQTFQRLSFSRGGCPGATGAGESSRELTGEGQLIHTADPALLTDEKERGEKPAPY